MTPPRTIVVAGGGGLIGSRLCAALRGRGDRVLSLVRRAPVAGEQFWDPEAGQLDPETFEGVDGVVHLGGAGIAERRWTASRKQVLRASRVTSTDLLCQRIGQARRPPRVFLCASAIGYYGNRGAEPLTEDSGRGDGFLPELCWAWERATDLARASGVRVVNLRIGMVLSRHGGALRTMLRPFRLGLGGVVGSGRQYVSWIALTDLIAAMDYALRHERITGAMNCTAPEPVTNREFTRVLGHVLARPTWLPMPGLLVRVLLGELGTTLLLSGARVLPAKLQSNGFEFCCGTLDAALRHELSVPERG